MKKLVKESLDERADIPKEILNLLLDVANYVQEELDLPITPIQDMYYDVDVEQYIAILPDTEHANLDVLDNVQEMVKRDYADYAEALTIQYSPEDRGIIISLDSRYF